MKQQGHKELAIARFREAYPLSSVSAAIILDLRSSVTNLDWSSSATGTDLVHMCGFGFLSEDIGRRHAVSVHNLLITLR
jgi:hypothetical protein